MKQTISSPQEPVGKYDHPDNDLCLYDTKRVFISIHLLDVIPQHMRGPAMLELWKFYQSNSFSCVNFKLNRLFCVIRLDYSVNINDC